MKKKTKIILLVTAVAFIPLAYIGDGDSLLGRVCSILCSLDFLIMFAAAVKVVCDSTRSDFQNAYDKALEESRKSPKEEDENGD